MQPTSEKTHKKITVDWPHKFAPGTCNFSSDDYDKLELPNFIGGFLVMMIKSYDTPLKSVMLELLELLMTKAYRSTDKSLNTEFHSLGNFAPSLSKIISQLNEIVFYFGHKSFSYCLSKFK